MITSVILPRFSRFSLPSPACLAPNKSRKATFRLRDSGRGGKARANLPSRALSRAIHHHALHAFISGYFLAYRHSRPSLFIRTKKRSIRSPQVDCCGWILAWSVGCIVSRRECATRASGCTNCRTRFGLTAISPASLFYAIIKRKCQWRCRGC